MIVVLRRWSDKPKTLIALFPEVPEDRAGLYCMSYETVGQHGPADYFGVVAESVPVTEDEAQPLLKELKRIGYDDLQIRHRAAAIHHHRRFVEARKT